MDRSRAEGCLLVQRGTELHPTRKGNLSLQNSISKFVFMAFKHDPFPSGFTWLPDHIGNFASLWPPPPYNYMENYISQLRRCKDGYNKAEFMIIESLIDYSFLSTDFFKN